MHTLGRAHLLVVAVILAAALGALLLVGDSARGAGSFDPYFSAGTPNLTDPTPGAKSDINASFNIDAPDYNFGGVISFTPPQFLVPADADITDGAWAGALDSGATLGLLNNPCQTPLNVHFNFYDATTNMGTTTTFNGQFGDTDGDGLHNGVTMYPDYLARILPGMTPRARLYGDTSVSGVLVSLNFLIFDPGTTITTASGVPIPTNEDLGYPSVTILQNIGDPDSAPAPNAITDFCSALTTATTLYGITKDNPDTTGTDESGQTYRQNPATDGTFVFTTFTVNQRDADGDGKENGLDPCPETPDPLDPRINDATNDSDGDGIPNVCDPGSNPQDFTNSDQDVDGYANRGDNCPLIANGALAGQTNQHDTDGDGIGDECDSNPTTPDGDQTVKCVTGNVDVGAGGTPVPPNAGNKVPCGSDTSTHTPTPGSSTPHTGTPTGTGTTASPTPTSSGPTPSGQTHTPTPSGSHTPTPSGPTPTGGPLVQGNVDCSPGAPDAVDGLKELRHVAGLSVSQTEPCPDIGTEVASIWGDVDCDGDVDSVDALKILRFVAALEVSQTEPCPDIGT